MARRAASIFLWLAALFVLILVGFWAMLPWLVSSDVVRAGIERELSDLTGQQVEIEGDVDLDLFPSPVARLEDLRVPGLAAPEETAPPDFLFVEEVEVAIPLSSLVSRELYFSQFRLVRPYMRIATDPAGEIDWAAIGGRLGEAVSTSQQEAEAPAAEQSDAGTASPPAAQYGRFGTVTVENGTVEYANPGPGEPEKITALTGTVSWPRLAATLNADLTGIWRGTAFQQRIEIDNAIHFFANRIARTRLDFASDALNFSFDGRMGIGETVFAEGATTLNTPSLRETLDWLQIGLAPGRAVGSLAMEGKIHGDFAKIRFSELSLTVEGNSGKGVVEIARRADSQPAITGTLDFVTLDIPSYLAALTGLPQEGDFDNPVSMSTINQMDLDLRLSATDATAGPLAITNLAAVTQIRNGEAVFEMADGTAYGGRVEARFELRETGRETPTAKLQLAAENIDTASIPRPGGGNSLLPLGLSSGNLSIEAPMERWSDLTTRATGTVALSSSGGVIGGFGFQTLSGQDGADRFFRLQDTAPDGSPYQSLRIEGSVQDGVVIIEEGFIQYPEGKLELGGVIPYATSSVALTTVAFPRADEGETSSPGVQHFIGGSWFNPYATPVLLPGPDL